MRRIIFTLLFAIITLPGSAQAIPPTVQITEPSNTVSLYSLSNSVIVKAIASDSEGVAQVRLVVNGTIVAADFIAPYEFIFQGSAFTDYNLQVEAVDTSGLATRSAARLIQYIRVNDNFGPNITVVTGNTNLLKSSNLAATLQKGEPQHAGVPGGKSVWFAWRPTVTGIAMVDTFGSEFDTILAVYTNRPNFAFALAVTNLSLVAANDNAGANQPNSRVKFTAFANMTYYIAVDGRDGVAGEIDLNIRSVPSRAAANDFLVNAARLSFTLQGTNIGATKEPGEPDHAGNSGGASMWYLLDTTPGAPHRISTEGSTFDTTLALYTNVVSPSQGIPLMENLRVVAENDDSSTGTNRTSEIIFTPRNFATYWIAVDGYNGAEGNIRITATRGPEPKPVPNDMFVNATRLFGTAALTNVNTTRATSEAGDPLMALSGGTPRSVWYRWIAPSNAPVYLSTKFSDFDTVMGVYTGTNIFNLSLVASNDDDPAGLQTSALIFNAVAGTEYRIGISGYLFATGNLVLALNQAAFYAPRILTQPLQGRFLISLADAQGTMLLEQSSDLINWIPVQTIEAPAVPIEIATNPELQKQFYRVRSLE
jgi:hypothetical protein